MTKTKEITLAEPQVSALTKLLADPDRLRDFPIETVERLFELDRQIRADGARRDFFVAFNRVQSQMIPVARKGTNEHTRSSYARAEEVFAMLDPIMLSEGFSRSLSTEECPTPDHLRFVLILRHIGGHEERHRLDAPIDNVGLKGAPTKIKLHGMASSYTYCERHLILKVFGVQVGEDDDGNGAGKGPGAEKISEEQAKDLDSLIDDVKASKGRLMAYFKIEKLEDIALSQYAGAVRMLEEKR